MICAVVGPAHVDVSGDPGIVNASSPSSLWTTQRIRPSESYPYVVFAPAASVLRRGELVLAANVRSYELGPVVIGVPPPPEPPLARPLTVGRRVLLSGWSMIEAT